MPTAKDIKDSGVLGPLFFCPDTMRFFGQTMRSFKTEWHDKEERIVRIYAPTRDNTGALVGTTERLLKIEGDFFNGSNLSERTS